MDKKRTSPSIIELGTARARPGEKAWGQLRVREAGKQVTLATCVVNGAAPGEHVAVIANQHGVEYNGVESIRLFCEQLDPKKLKGTFFAIPSANPRAALSGHQTFVEEEAKRETAAEYDNEYNMNRVWPGRKGGTLVERVVHEIWTRAVFAPHATASLFVDFHCHMNPTAVYADDHATADLGVVAGIENIIVTGSSEKVRTSNRVCCENGVRGMTIELFPQQWFVPEAIERGRRALGNLLKFWGMLSGKLDLPEEAIVLDPWRDHRRADETFARPSFMDYNSAHDGLLVPRKETYDTVRKGEVVAHIIDPRTGQVVEECRAPMSGAIYGYRTDRKAACHKGRRVFIVAIAKRVRPAEYVKKLRPEDCRRPSEPT